MGRWQAVGEIQIRALVAGGYEGTGGLTNAFTCVARWARERRRMLRLRPCWVTAPRFLLRGPVSRSVRERGLVGSGFFGEGFLGEVTQDSFVEGGEGVEFGGGEQVDEMPADVVHVLGRCVLNGAASGGQQADHGAAAVGGVGFAGDQPSLLHAPDLVGEPALLPLHEGTQFLRGHLPRGVLREHRQDLVVGPGQSGVLE